MNPCALLDLAQEGRLDKEQSVLFDAHLSECASCRESMELWEESNRHLDAYFFERSRDPSGSAKARLLEAADNSSSMKPLFWVIPSAAVAAAAVIAFVLVGAPPAGDVAEDETPSPSVASYDYQLIYPESPDAARSVAADALLKGAAGGHVVRFRNSLLGMDRTTEIGVTVSSKRNNGFLLKTGIVAAELPLVEHRETLSIKAGSLTIAVKGTVFIHKGFGPID